MLPQTGTKLAKKRDSKFGALLWRHLTPQRKTAIQVHNYNPSCIQLIQKSFGKFTYYMTFGAHKHCTFRAVFGPPMRNLTLAISAM